MNAGVKHIAAWLSVAIFATFTLIYNIGGRPLWGDEAETAILAVNITKYGLPLNSDGKNLITLYGQTVDSNERHIWTWRPWLGEYLMAASFSLIGKSTTAARLPFAIVGIFCVCALMFLVLRIYGDYNRAALSGLILASTEIFILHVRQGRYYSLIIFGQIWLIYGLYLLLRRRDYSAVPHIAAALTLQFYCNYVVIPGNIIAIGIWAALIHKRHERILNRIGVGAVLFVLAALPWLLYARPWRQGSYAEGVNFLHGVFVYSKEIHFHIFPFTLLILPLIYHIYRRLKAAAAGAPAHETPLSTPMEADIEKLLWLAAPLQVLILSFGPGQNLRYITPVLPVFAIIEAGLLMRYIRQGILRAALIIVLVTSNFISAPLSFDGRHTPRLTVSNLISSITEPYTNRLDDVLRFLRQQGHPGQSVFVFDPEFPLIFYTDMKVIDARLSNSFPADKLPDWIFPVSASGISGKAAIALPESLFKYYDTVSLPVHNSSRRGDIPEPDQYEYFTNREIVPMVVYKRKAVAQ
ncbi:MAG: glycosyltransferase family 39 protein [Nitrospirae bacterium]|nr:glycosyltransferase family 39 protein [Nitrospirota bacterium]